MGTNKNVLKLIVIMKNSVNSENPQVMIFYYTMGQSDKLLVKTVPDFWSLVFSWDNNMQHDTLVMLASSNELKLPVGRPCNHMGNHHRSSTAYHVAELGRSVGEVYVKHF